MIIRNIAQNLSQEEAAFATLIANQDGCKRVFPPGATLTLTQSGLLAVLLERQRYAAIQAARRRAQPAYMGAALLNTLTRPLHALKPRPLVHDSVKPLIRTAPRHT